MGCVPRAMRHAQHVAPGVSNDARRTGRIECDHVQAAGERCVLLCKFLDTAHRLT
jgi:hypothetical protein